MKKLWISLLVVSALIMSCTTNSDNANSTSRSVSLFLTDAPEAFGQNLANKPPMLRFSAVNLDIAGIQYQIIDTTKHKEICSKEGKFNGLFEDNHQRGFRPELKDTTSWQSLDFSEKTVTISMLSNGDSVLLSNITLPANTMIGKIKLKLGKNSTVVLADDAQTVKPLLIADKSDSTLIVHLFNNPPKGKYNLMFDFDIARSIFVAKNGDCYLRPVMRGFIMEKTGEIFGSILPLTLKTKVFVVTSNDTIATVSDVKHHNRFKLSGFEDGTYQVQFMPLDTIGSVTLTKSVTIDKHKPVSLGSVKVVN